MDLVYVKIIYNDVVLFCSFMNLIRLLFRKAIILVLLTSVPN